MPRHVAAFPDGTSALLLHVAGTIPVVFRGSTYRFPLSIWVPHAYPREPPLVYVTPTPSMVVRPGQHVDPQGQVYHPYLARWCDFWDVRRSRSRRAWARTPRLTGMQRSTIQDFVAVLGDVFAKEPPVISREAPRPAQSAQTAPTPPPVPPLPPEMAPGSPRLPQHSRGEPGPPRPPAKLTDPDAQPRVPSRYESAPQLPLEAHGHDHTQPHPHGPRTALYQQTSHDVAPRKTGPSTAQQPQPPAPWPAHPPPGPWHAGWNGAGVAEQQRPPAPRQAPPNLLDEPLAPTEPGAPPPPPIPRNPEKEALLGHLGQRLASMRLRSRQQNEASMAGLEAQRAAMQTAAAGLQSEAGQLTQLSQVLTSNAHILHEALRRADGVIEGSKHQPAPDVDELLVAPTVAANQLYALVAEERALGDAVFMMGRAVERGRVAPAVFAKTTRWLAREWFLKKALARKVGVGMGMGIDVA